MADDTNHDAAAPGEEPEERLSSRILQEQMEAKAKREAAEASEPWPGDTQQEPPPSKPQPGKKKPKGNYGVGYARPPTHTQFKKGAANPSRGRRPGSKNKSGARRVLEDIKIPLSVDGKKRRLPLGEAVTLQTGQAALQGDPVARRIIVNAQLALERMAEPGPEPPSPEKEAEKRRLSTEVGRFMVDCLDLFANLRHYGLLIKVDGKLTIPASVIKAADVHRPRRYKQSSYDTADSLGADETTGDPDVVLDPDKDISAEERKELRDEVTPQAWKDMMAEAAPQPTRRTKKPTRKPQGEPDAETTVKPPAREGDRAAPPTGEDEVMSPSGETGSSAENPARQRSADELIDEILGLNGKKKE